MATSKGESPEVPLGDLRAAGRPGALPVRCLVCSSSSSSRGHCQMSLRNLKIENNLPVKEMNLLCTAFWWLQLGSNMLFRMVRAADSLPWASSHSSSCSVQGQAAAPGQQFGSRSAAITTCDFMLVSRLALTLNPTHQTGGHAVHA